jgi:hypothetical protein
VASVSRLKHPVTDALKQFAAALEKAGIDPARGRQWHVSTVQNLLARESVL